MKKIILTVFAATTIFACNNSCEKTECGSENHTCTEECEKVAPEEETKALPMNITEETSETELAEHVCTADCREGACSYAHGEKGHACG